MGVDLATAPDRGIDVQYVQYRGGDEPLVSVSMCPGKFAVGRVQYVRQFKCISRRDNVTKRLFYAHARDAATTRY